MSRTKATVNAFTAGHEGPQSHVGQTMQAVDVVLRYDSRSDGFQFSGHVGGDSTSVTGWQPHGQDHPRGQMFAFCQPPQSLYPQSAVIVDLSGGRTI